MKKILFAGLTSLFVMNPFLYANNNKKMPEKKILYKNIYKGEELSTIKKVYPESHFVSDNQKKEIINFFSLSFLNQLNLFRINKNIIAVLNPKTQDRVIGLLIYSENSDSTALLNKFIKKDNLGFKSSLVVYTDGTIYDKKRFKTLNKMQQYLLLLNTNLVASHTRRAMFYINQVFESNKTHKGVFYLKIDKVKLKAGCKICAFLNGEKFERQKYSGIFVYYRDKGGK